MLSILSRTKACAVHAGLFHLLLLWRVLTSSSMVSFLSLLSSSGLIATPLIWDVMVDSKSMHSFTQSRTKLRKKKTTPIQERKAIAMPKPHSEKSILIHGLSSIQEKLTSSRPPLMRHLPVCQFMLPILTSNCILEVFLTQRTVLVNLTMLSQL